MRKILHINEKGGRFGGTEEYIAALVTSMSRAGIGSHLIYDHAPGPLPEDLASAVRIDGLGLRNFERDLSGDVLRIVAEIGPDIVYVHNIFDGRIMRALDAPVRPPDQPTRDHHVVLYSGRITAEKGLHIAIEALAQVRQDDGVLFQIAGAIEDEAYWSRCLALAERARSRNSSLLIQYQGHLAYDKIDALYVEADVVVVPSTWAEPSGTVVAEALVHGAAVVASDVGGMDTWLNDGTTGLFADPGRVETFTTALERLLRDPALRRHLADAGRRLVAQNYTDAIHVARLQDLVRMLG